MSTFEFSKISKIINLDSNWEEYFENPVNDYFNITKSSVRIIKSIKKGAYLKHVPDNYAPSGTIGYALIRGINCQARCTYCYLQTYFKSSDIVRFGNIKDYLYFLELFINRFKKIYPDKILIFYDGDFQDSFGYNFIKENIFQINEIINLISKYDKVYLEVRTKCLIENNNFKIYDFLNISKQLIVAITFSPQSIIDKYEKGTSDLNIRINFGKYIISRGGILGPRIDPIIFDSNNIEYCLDNYLGLINLIKDNIQEDHIYNIGIGVLRLKQNLYKYLKSVNNNLINNLVYQEGFWKYDEKTRSYIYDKIKQFINSKLIYICM